MLCLKPFRKGIEEFGCGQCLPCRVNKRRTWTIRLVLESMLHPASMFVTLTYAEEPAGRTLVPRDAQLWLKRLRYELAPARVRFFLVGEYGEKTQRPHYHAAVYGAFDPAAVDRSWDRGFTKTGLVTIQSSMYMAGYTTKKMTNKRDPYVQKLLGGRHPEFTRMSLRPGIGAGAAAAIAAYYKTPIGRTGLSIDPDVGSVLRMDGRLWPLGRYVKDKVRSEAGVDSSMVDESVHERLMGAMQELELLDYDMVRADRDARAIAGAGKLVRERSSATL